jgi:hypothetical protein
MAGPTFAKEGQTYQVPLATIVSVVKMMLTARPNDTTQLDRLVERIGAVNVPVPGEVINTVKSALYESGIHERVPAARSMIGLESAVGPAGGDDCPDYRCPHISH